MALQQIIDKSLQRLESIPDDFIGMVNKQTCYYLIDNEIAISYDDFFNQYIVLVNQDIDYD